MKLSLRPEAERYIDEQVRAGRFPSAEAVVEAALYEMQAFVPELDDEDIAAINETEIQANRGEGMELDAFRQQMNRRFAGN